MSTNERGLPLFERDSLKSAKIVYKRIFGHNAADNSDGETRFCQEIFRNKYIRHSQTMRTPSLPRF